MGGNDQRRAVRNRPDQTHISFRPPLMEIQCALPWDNYVACRVGPSHRPGDRRVLEVAPLALTVDFHQPEPFGYERRFDPGVEPHKRTPDIRRYQQFAEAGEISLVQRDHLGPWDPGQTARLHDLPTVRFIMPPLAQSPGQPDDLIVLIILVYFWSSGDHALHP